MPRLGVYAFPQAGSYETMLAVARRAEEAGFDSLWVADETPMAYPGIIGFEAWTSLAALARDTSRIGLGTLVTPPVMRHPLVTAMAAATVDQASNGRLTVGMGVGGVPEDNAGMGQGGLRAGDLVDRLDEQIDTVDRLLRGETVTREGGFYPTANAVVERPIQQPRPPILVAAQGPRSIAIAARRADIWNSMGGQPLDGDRVSRDDAVATTRRHIELLDAAALAADRDPASIRRSIFAWRAGAFESWDAMTDFIGRYRELGFTEFIFSWPGEPAADAILDRLGAELFPALRREAAERA